MATVDEIGNRGSKLCIQICVNNVSDEIHSKTKQIVRKSRKHLLDEKIGLGSITWISPLESEHFQEFQLHQLPIEKQRILGIENFDWSFWATTNQPHWDAIGIAQDGTIVLLEAKAHVEEIEGPGCKAISEESKERIKKAIVEVMGNNPIWLKKYYQTANRYVFLDKMLKAGKKTCLVFLNFINDVSYKPEPQNVWDEYLSEMHKNYPTPKSLEPYTKYIFMDLWKETGITPLSNSDYKAFYTEYDFYQIFTRLEDIFRVNQYRLSIDFEEEVLRRKRMSELSGSLCLQESDLPNEKWVFVNNNENVLVSSYGRLKFKSGKIIPQKDYAKPPKVGYLKADSEIINLDYTYRLVAHAFFGEPPRPSYQIHHIINDGFNNSVGNLVYLTKIQHDRVEKFKIKYSN